SLARTGRPDYQNVRLAQFNIARLLVQENPFVVVIDRDREFLLRAVLSNDVAIQELLDLRRARKPLCRRSRLFTFLIFQDRLANAHALVADIRARIVRRRTDQLFDLLLCLVAKGAAQRFVWVKFLHWYEGLVSAELLRSLYSYSRPIYPRSKRESRSGTDYRERASRTRLERQSTSRLKN